MKSVSRVTSYLLFLLIVLIPFSVRHVFDSSWNFQTGAYSDFTSLSIYISDLVLVALIGFTFLMKPKPWDIPRAWKITAVLAGAWLILVLFLQSRETLHLQVYFSLRILFLLIFASAVSQIHVSREKLAWLFSILGAIQGLIAIFQFYFQKSVGLFILGESHLSSDTLGVAKIVSHGTKLIRSYGTFPHSNLLAAFLLVSTLFNLYLLTKTNHSPRGEKISRGEDAQPRNILLYLALFLNIFGIFLSFSRAGILALVISAAIFIAYLLYIKGFSAVSRGMVALAGAGIVSVLVIFPYLTTRTTISDEAVKERVFYNHIGEKIVKNKPFFGIGPGNSVLHMKQYAKDQFQDDLKPWEVQPIHNYYLLSWAEWGIGSILLLFLIVFSIITLVKTKKESWTILLIAITSGFLVLFLFDHYFYTIWPTQLLLWLVVGLGLNTISRETIYDTVSEK